MIEPIRDIAAEPMSMRSAFNGVQLSSRVMPATGSVGGSDWCETFAVSDEILALSIGDVCGRGDGKAATMGGLRQAIRFAAGRGLDPGLTLTVANRFLYDNDPDENASAIVALLNTRERSLTFANAGHPAPLIAGPLGTAFLDYCEVDLPLGIVNELAPAVRVVNLPAATLLVLYTDGVIEHNRRALQGEAQLREAAMFAYQAKDLPSASVIERQMFLTGSNDDDAAILTVRTGGVPMMRGAA